MTEMTHFNFKRIQARRRENESKSMNTFQVVVKRNILYIENVVYFAANLYETTTRLSLPEIGIEINNICTGLLALNQYA